MERILYGKKAEDRRVKARAEAGRAGQRLGGGEFSTTGKSRCGGGRYFQNQRGVRPRLLRLRHIWI